MSATKDDRKSQKIAVKCKNFLDVHATVDAFNVFKRVLLELSTFIHHFATGNDKSVKHDDKNVLKYYNEYVNQIASYLMKIIEFHLSTFSVRVQELASPRGICKSCKFLSNEFERKKHAIRQKMEIRKRSTIDIRIIH